MIILAATPIGHLGDHSSRLVEALAKADLIVAEDTRKAKTLMSALGVKGHQPIRAMHEHNERDVVREIISLATTQDVVVLTDAGMPGISDPGYVIASAAHAEGVRVSVIPGPSAVIAALAASGLPTDRFCFEGFVPKKGRIELFESLADEKRTMVFFESPHRLPETLALMGRAWGGDRRATVCRELTKMFEEVRQGTLEDLANRFAEGVKGEITVVVEGNRGQTASMDEALQAMSTLIDGGLRGTQAAKQVAGETGLSKREIYDAWSKAQA